MTYKAAFFACLVSVVSCLSPAYGEEADCRAFSPGNQLPQVVRPEIGRGAVTLCNRGYVVMASPVTHGPLWAAEHLWSDDIEAAWTLARHGQFTPDPRWPASAALGDYRRSAYDRGHMAPSGDQPTPQDQAETFMLSNVVPQTASLNEGIWAKIERRVREMTEQEGEIYVVTGPAFHLRPVETIGPDHVFVPSSTWKAVYSPAREKAGVYVCKNSQQHPHCDQVTVATLTRNTGIDPFPGLPARVKNEAWRMPAP
ncbi:DNA/RNA non-specific endonuclease [Acetobacter conturbans]|uniref:Endonuclease n=1 Tax=Acetobacter conturbans TaxID=1737472 RepID=A0ABX0K2F7_9PROT|nr:DNA/RNA non-specific endonuclease [Acetobacter conturbans]NHN89843.1 DNA/RNA non-specific endonuclease [Acetobacter conturbans]